MRQRIALFGGALTHQIKNRYESSMGATTNFVLLKQIFGSCLNSAIMGTWIWLFVNGCEGQNQISAVTGF